MFDGSLFQLAANPAPSSDADAGRAVIMFIVLAGGLAVFLFGIVLITALRRRSHDRAAQKAASDAADAWQAAADRAEPFPRSKE